MRFNGDRLFSCIDFEVTVAVTELAEARVDFEKAVTALTKAEKGESTVKVQHACAQQVTDRKVQASCTMAGTKGGMKEHFYDTKDLQNDQLMRECLESKGSWQSNITKGDMRADKRREQLTEAMDHSFEILRRNRDGN